MSNGKRIIDGLEDALAGNAMTTRVDCRNIDMIRAENERLLAEVKRLEGELDSMSPVIDSAVEWWRGSSLSEKRADDLSDACRSYVYGAEDASDEAVQDNGGYHISVPRNLWHWMLKLESELRKKADGADEARALALSLAEALDGHHRCALDDDEYYVRSVLHGETVAALSSPALLKLRGKE